MAECARCGGFVTDDYLRVCGDNDGRVESCPSCPRQSATEDADTGSDGVPLREIGATGSEESATARDGSATGTATSPGDGDDEPSPDGPRSRLSRMIQALALG